jgi:hypothetical protein
VDKMPRLKILFADDQIPDESIPDDSLESTLREQYPQLSNDLIRDFVATRQAVKTLRGAGYDVTAARTYKDALEKVKSSHFEVAIVDLGWFFDMDVLPNFSKGVLPKDREFAGWDICEAIDKADEERQSRPTLQIVYSYKFIEDPSASLMAADKGKLPVFKNYNEATDQILRAAVKFIETHLESPSLEEFAHKAAEDFHEMTISTLKGSLAQQKQWSRLTLVFVALSITLVLIAAIFAISGNVRVGTFTSISSTLTSVISGLLFLQLRRAQKTVAKNEEQIERQNKDAIERLYSTMTKPTSRTTSQDTSP